MLWRRQYAATPGSLPAVVNVVSSSAAVGIELLMSKVPRSSGVFGQDTDLQSCEDLITVIDDGVGIRIIRELG